MISHIKYPQSDNCIVFIHGLGGSKGTFNNFSEYLSKKWYLENGIMIYFFSYYKKIFNLFLNRKNTSFYNEYFVVRVFDYLQGGILFIIKSTWSKRNTHNTNLLSKYIEENCDEYKNIILVAHSMGGIIARQYLVNCRKELIDIRRFKMLVTYATPHKGSHIANILTIKNIPLLKYVYKKVSGILNFRISPQIGDLSEFSNFLKNLDKDWRDFNIENNVQFLRITGKNDRIVKKDSAQLHLEDIENVFEYEYTHGSIISPKVEDKVFPPIDIFIEKLNNIEFDTESYYEELEEEINYDQDEEDYQ